jgi:hypothetical protein
MSKFEIEPGRGKRVLAIVFAVTAIGALIFSQRASSRIIAGVILLGAWEMAFLPSLPLNLRIGEIYQKARQGWRMSRASRIINYVSYALIILAIYLQWHGR